MLALYGQTFDDPWHYDDLAELTPRVREFAPDVDASHYRGDVVRWSWAVDYRLHGDDPAGYHVTNWIVHVGCAWLLAALVVALGSSRPAGAIAALLFAVHPLATQSVSYLTQRSTSIAGLFVLATVVAWLRFRGAGAAGRWGWYAACVALFAVGLHTKHVAITAPALIGIAELLCRPGGRSFAAGSRGGGLRAATFALAPLVALAGWRALEYLPGLEWAGGAVGSAAPTLGGTAGAEAGVVGAAGAGAGANPRPGDIGLTSYLWTQPLAIARYLALTVWPVGQNLLHDLPRVASPGDPRLLPALAICAVPFVVFAATVRRAPLVAFGAAWFAVTLLPTSSFVASSGLIYEHRAYVPLLGFAIVAAAAGDWLVSRWGAESAVVRRAFLAVALAVILALSIATHRRNAVWDSEVSLWEDVARKSPQLVEAHLNLGTALHRAGRSEAAVRSLRQADALSPDDVGVLTSLGAALLATDDAEAAAATLERAVALEPTNAGTWLNFGNAAWRNGDLPQAEAAYREAAALDPRGFPAAYNLGKILLQRGRAGDAIAAWSPHWPSQQGDANFANDFGVAWLLAGDADSAIVRLERAVALRPDWEAAHANLSEARRRRASSSNPSTPTE